MTGDHGRDNANTPSPPLANPPPTVVENAHTPDPNLRPSEEFTPDTSPRSAEDGGVARVGARDVERPISPPEGNETEAAGGDELHDRLAKRDQTPVDEGGSSSLA